MEKDNKYINFLKRNFIIKIFFNLFDQFNNLIPSQNTKTRIMSSLVLLPISIIAIFYSEDLFFLLALTISIIMTMEWINITAKAKNQKKWRIIGFFYILVPIFCMVKIRFIEPYILLWMFVIIWSTDIFAFFAGRAIGGPKLAINISPNKTWSGLLGGVIASSFVGLISSIIFPGSVLFFVVVSSILSLVEQISDLIESKIKRIFSVKDSGSIIPGHGGLIDRLDGVILVAPLVFCLILIFPQNFFN